MVERRLISATQAARQPTSRVFSRAAKEREMENLIARVATAADLSPDVARKAVALIGDFIQREAPEEAVQELFEKAPAFPSIIASSTRTGGEGMGGGMIGDAWVMFPPDFLLIHIVLLDGTGRQVLRLKTCSEGIRKNRNLISVIILANI